MERAYTTVETHSVEQDSITRDKTQSKATLDEQSSEGHMRQETMGEGDASARQKTPSIPS